MDQPPVPPVAATSSYAAKPAEQPAPPAGPAQPFVPFHNEFYRFGLGRVGGDWHPAMRLTLVLASVMAL